MPKVPELNFPVFKVKSSELSPQEKLDGRYWRYKKNKPPKDVYKPKRTKLKDKGLISEQIAQQNHIRSIRNEH